MGFVRDLTGKTAVKAATKAADAQVLGAKEASALFDPFKGIGEQGLAQAGFLTDPQAQFDFLQSNPLFQMGLENLNTQTQQSAAARGRLSAGDTLQQLNQNALLAASPLIQQQKQSIGDLLNYGLTTAGNQGNLRTGQAAAAAGGIVGAANARGQAAQNILNLAGGVGSSIGSAFGGAAGGGAIGGIASGIGALFSDDRLKDNIKKTGEKNGFNMYKWDWNKAANELGLFGNDEGVLASEVEKINPNAISYDRGYRKVNYEMIGV